MAVKKKDRNRAANQFLNDIRKMNQQVRILTRPAERTEYGSITRSGILGMSQTFALYGSNILNYATKVHEKAFFGSQIKLKGKASFEKRKQFFTEAIDYCDLILSELDLCLYLFATSKVKKKSIQHLSMLTYVAKESLRTRIVDDQMLFKTYHSKKA